jgi:pilus assembly protein Flp/PilA
MHDSKRCKEKKMRSLKKKESGASLVEYALLVALIAVVAIGAVTFLGQRVSLRLSTVASAVGPTN